MAHAYTPGLHVSERTRLRKHRRLPLPGEVLAEKGQLVSAETVVARAELPGDVVLINAVSQLGCTPGELTSYLTKGQGDEVREGELFGETRPWIKLFRSQLTAPAAGTLESISAVTGQIVLRKPPRPIDLAAYVDGRVVEVVPGEGVDVEVEASFIQGIFGVGGEATGTLAVAVDSPDADLKPEHVHDELAGKVVVAGAFASAELLKRCADVGVAGLIVGGFHDRDLRAILGYDLGVAITGTEQIGLTLIMTEGFGRIAMARRTFELLKSREGQKASVNGATQIRAGVLRPEIVIAWHAGQHPQSEPRAPASGLRPGSMVRIIREPLFGRLGKVADLPHEPRTIATEAKVRVAEIELDDGQQTVVPRANLEMIEP
jgi:hypothetical protein